MENARGIQSFLGTNFRGFQHKTIVNSRFMVFFAPSNCQRWNYYTERKMENEGKLFIESYKLINQNHLQYLRVPSWHEWYLSINYLHLSSYSHHTFFFFSAHFISYFQLLSESLQATDLCTFCAYNPAFWGIPPIPLHSFS